MSSFQLPGMVPDSLSEFRSVRDLSIYYYNWLAFEHVQEMSSVCVCVCVCVISVVLVLGGNWLCELVTKFLLVLQKGFFTDR